MIKCSEIRRKSKMRVFTRNRKQIFFRIGFGIFGFLFVVNILRLVLNQKTIIVEELSDSRFIFDTQPNTTSTVTVSLDRNTSMEIMKTVTSSISPGVSSKPCHIDTSKLRKREKVVTDVGDFRFLNARINVTEWGGRYRPKHCNPASRIAIIIPFRDRDSHLKIFFYNVIPKLLRQNLDFTVFVVEQAPDANFNRGMMRNIGFLEASKIADFDCFVFNDVDTIMEDDRNFIKCSKSNVRHLVTGVDRDKYKLKYSTLVGGIIAFTKEQFMTVNGYSNFFFMWGAEDDEIEQRIKNNGMKIERPAVEIGYVTTLKHQRDPEIESRFDILWSRNNSTAKVDGLNSVKYTVKLIEKRKLYTWIYVSIDEKEVLKNLRVPKKKKRRRRH